MLNVLEAYTSGGNGTANHDGAHKHCFKSRSDGYTRLDIAHNRTDQHAGE